MPRTWRSRASRAAPRLIAVVWAVWSAATAASYPGDPPPQLAGVGAVLPVPLWVVWAVPTVLLFLGAVVPPGASERSKRVARIMRMTGLSIIAGLLMVWAVAFLGTELSRGWVSAKNYVILSIMAFASAWFIGRETVSVAAAREG